MSALAIAAVTATLRGKLANHLQLHDVTTLAPDKANQDNPSQRLNLFLYHVSPNAAWRNQIIPTRAKGGEQAPAPLALTLHYLLTAYGDQPNGETDHALLGRAMLWIHDHPLLTRADIQGALSLDGALSGARLERQFEPVRLTSETLSVDEMSKLWTTFQTQYRVSTTYQASVVLLESEKEARIPLPVLKRGPEDRGPEVTASMPAVLEGLEYRDLRNQESPLSAAQLGDVVTLRGRSLPGVLGTVVVRNPRLRPTDLDPDADVVARLRPLEGSNQDQLIIRLDEFAGNWVAGPLQIMVERPRASGRPRRSAPLFLALAPRITNGAAVTATISANAERRRLTVQTNPPIPLDNGALPDVTLLLTPTEGSQNVSPIPAEPIAPRVGRLSTSEASFDITNVPPGVYRVRIRVETVETLIMKRQGLTVEFDESQRIRL
jgi:hypothetical protein